MFEVRNRLLCIYSTLASAWFTSRSQLAAHSGFAFEREGSTNILVSGSKGRSAARQNVPVTTDHRNGRRRRPAACLQKPTPHQPPTPSSSSLSTLSIKSSSLNAIRANCLFSSRCRVTELMRAATSRASLINSRSAFLSRSSKRLG